MPRSGPARRGYDDERRSTGAAGSVVVFSFGIILLFAALSGAFILKWKADLVPLGDSPSAIVDAAQVCTDVKQQNAQYVEKITAASAAPSAGASGATDGQQRAGLFTEWVGKLHSQATRTDNAELQAAIDGFAGTVEAAQSGAAATTAGLTELVSQGEKSIEPHCG